MSIPVPLTSGAVAVSTGAITVPLPSGIVADDVLILQIQNAVGPVGSDILATITNAGGGTWTAIDPSQAGNTTRLTVYWSRYNGTQTAPTIQDTGDHTQGQIHAVRGCIATGSPINASNGDAPIFSETTSLITGITTTATDCLVMDLICGEGPSAISTAVYSGWTNINLSTVTERADNATNVGVGGSIGMATGGMAAAGFTGTTSVAHADFRVAYKKIALTPVAGTPPPPGSGITIGRNAKGQATFAGTAKLVLGWYDSGLEGAGGSLDMSGHLTVRNMSRFTGKTNAYINLYSGTQDNVLRLCDALVTYSMYSVAIGNAAYDWTNGVSGTVLGNSNANGPFDVVDDSNSFRANFAGKARAAATYLWDETREDALPDLQTWQATYKASMPTLATWGVCWHVFIPPIKAYAASSVGDWISADPYAIGAGSEIAPGGSSGNTYGYSNFDIGHTAAAVRYWGLQGGKVPMLVLQAFKFGSASRAITDSEMFSHAVAALTEGVFGLWWWAMGVQSGALNTSVWTTTERERVLAQVESITTLLTSLESILLSDPNPALLTANSSSIGNAITWRRNLLTVLTTGGVDTPTWFDAVRQSFVDEANRLALPTPDTSLSDHVLDQSGNVRTRCWESGGFGYVFSYNLHPNPQTVTLQWHSPVSLIDVMGESRTITAQGDGRTWVDTWGGSSSLRQGTFNQAHIYKLTLATVGSPISGDLSKTLDAMTVDLQGTVGAATPSADTFPFWDQSDQEMIPWPGRLVGARAPLAYEFLLTVPAGSTAATVSGYEIILDAPEIRETVASFSVAATTGTRLILAKTYRVIKAVNVTLIDNGGTAVTARVFDKDEVNGPLVKLFDAAGAVVAGVIDAEVIGS